MKRIAALLMAATVFVTSGVAVAQSPTATSTASPTATGTATATATAGTGGPAPAATGSGGFLDSEDRSGGAALGMVGGLLLVAAAGAGAALKARQVR